MKSSARFLVALLVASSLLGVRGFAADADGDGIEDSCDPCPSYANSDLYDRNGDGVPNTCQCGDPNGSGAYEAADLFEAFWCLGDEDPDGDCNHSLFNGDANNSGRWEADDLFLIFQAILDLRTVPSLRCSARPEGTPVAGASSICSQGSSFVSADANNTEATLDTGFPTRLESASPVDSTEPRSVEEGDIYRLLSESLILNLNAYRGLQVIDFSNVAEPSVAGRLQVAGTPVELYTIGTRAFVLLNSWQGYSRALDPGRVDRFDGGLVLSVDLSDPTQPRVIDRAHIPGYIQTSRLTRAGAQAALYVTTSGHAQWQNEDGQLVWESRTVVKSFDVSDGGLVPRSELNLGGYVADMQATPEALLVARTDWAGGSSNSLVSVVDISDPSGVMVEGGQVLAAGRVFSQFNMDLHRGILRVVSGSQGSGTRTNHVQTFDASSIQNLTPIDHATFGRNESLFATLFLGNKAFFVTYLRVDPFHAFQIDDAGSITEMSEFVVSGWNDFFRAVQDQERLVGIGINDENGRQLSVSLYDVTDLTNPEPLLARAEVEADHSWSEANWDHRAFSVIEDAVQVDGPNGVSETGLVLLPFTGSSSALGAYTSAVQIFTFSQGTLTQRGLMEHGTPVRRSFLAASETTANLSEQELSLFDTADVDNPEELGRLELAPNYSDFFVFGDYAARVKDPNVYFNSWWNPELKQPPASVEIVSRTEHPDSAEPLARFEIPSGASTHQVGDVLVAIDRRVLGPYTWPPEYESTVSVYDLSEPTEPRLASSFVTDRLNPGYPFYPIFAATGFDLSRPFPIFAQSGDDVQSVEAGLVFLQRHQEQELIGNEEVCTRYPSDPGQCSSPDECTQYTGGILCRSLDGAEAYCTGSLYECSQPSGGAYTCTSIDPTAIETTESCYEYPRYRYWQRFTVDVLDLSSPADAALADAIELPRKDEGVSMLADGSDVWVSIKRPATLASEDRPHVRYFILRIDLAEPSEPVLHEAINVPGELLAIDGNTIFTRDTVWGPEIVETAIARSDLIPPRAFLRAKRVFPDQQVEGILLDGAGQLLVSHRLSWTIASQRQIAQPLQYMTVLDAFADDFDELARVEVDDWATLQDARVGRALFQVPGGILVFNLDDPANPYPQAFFATRGWPRRILVDRRQIIFAASQFGIYAFDLDTVNLAPPGSF